jgi:endonuclease I
MILQKRYSNLKYACLIIVVIALGALSGFAQEGKGQQSARKELLQKTLRLLDKIENESPQSHADLVKVRERVLGIYKNPIILSPSVDEPQTNFARRSSRNSRSNRNDDWRQFYNSLASLSNDALQTKIRQKIQNQKAIEYRDARRLVMLNVDNFDNQIECIYTGKKVDADQMPKSQVMNIEHSWPQSKGAKGIAKSDMHHLFPTDPIANSTRSSLPFGMVDDPSWEDGGSKCDGEVFEPRPKYRGNIARALFYFSVRYQMHIDRDEEEVLRRWNREDPVDANERARNDRVEQIQGNRNPFVDHPELADRISDF